MFAIGLLPAEISYCWILLEHEHEHSSCVVVGGWGCAAAAVVLALAKRAMYLTRTSIPKSDHDLFHGQSWTVYSCNGFFIGRRSPFLRGSIAQCARSRRFLSAATNSQGPCRKGAIVSWRRSHFSLSHSSPPT